mgnify:CR=1 FL=1
MDGRFAPNEVKEPPVREIDACNPSWYKYARTNTRKSQEDGYGGITLQRSDAGIFVQIERTWGKRYMSDVL